MFEISELSLQRKAMKNVLYFTLVVGLIIANFFVFSCGKTNKVTDKQKEAPATTQITKQEKELDATSKADAASLLTADASDVSDATAKKEEEVAVTDKTEADEATVAARKARLADAKKKAAELAAEKKKEASKAATTKKSSSTAKANTAAKAPAPKKEAKKPSANSMAAKIDFSKKTHEFGYIDMGDVVEHDFVFTNTGKTPLIIHDAKTTCGCTTPEIPKAPIAPGEQGILKVKFDSKGKIGSQNKEVTVYSNAEPAVTKVFMKGVVFTKSEEEKAAPAAESDEGSAPSASSEAQAIAVPMSNKTSGDTSPVEDAIESTLEESKKKKKGLKKSRIKP